MSSDVQLLEQWRAGDRDAGSELFERHFDGIYRFFANKIQGDVDDLVQKTFTACVEGRDRFRGDASFRTYLFAVAHNVLRAYLRTKRRDGERFDPGVTSIFDLGLSPTVLVAKHREQQIMLAALRRIPIDHQIVLELYYWESMSAAALGEVLGAPEGTIRGRLRRAKQLLREQIEQVATSQALVQSTCGGLDTWARSLRQQVGDGAE